MSLPAEIFDEIRSRVVQGYDNRETVFEWVLASMPRALGIDAAEYGRDDLDAGTAARLRDAIERAFFARAKEMESWPTPTDCARLRNAFEALDRAGIVAVDNAGLDQKEGLSTAIAISLARDELGGAQTHGYCFFTWNDLARAIDGEGLSLAYGTFEQDPPPALPPPAARCPHCNGRGWVAAKDPSHGSETCAACHGVQPVAKREEPMLDKGEQVGASVAQACRDAGLRVEWSGSGDDFITLPDFRWQRALVVTQPSDVLDFLDSWELELRAGYTAAGDVLAMLQERAADWFEACSDFGPALMERLRAHTERFLDAQRAREGTWLEPTINDRIAGAFGELEQRGILARECMGLTIQDGWGYAGMESLGDRRGVVFFHQGDVIDGVNGRGLWIAFGAAGVEPPAGDPATLALGGEVVSVLVAHGVGCRWSHAADERIRVLPFEWRRRRWTTAPSYTRLPSASTSVAEAVASPSPAASRPAVAASAARCGIVVRAVRDESRFDLRRTRQMQAAWTSLGNSGDAQVGHLGLPHVFVPAGGYTTVVPQPTVANLRQDRNDVFLRGVRAREARP